MKLGDYLKQLFKKEEAKQKALRNLREAFRFLKLPHTLNMSDEELLKWLEDYPPGIHTPQAPVNYVPSYIEIKPADAQTEWKPESVIPVVMTPEYQAMLLDRFPMTTEELEKVLRRCGQDVTKLTTVLKLMEFTFKTDKEVLANYDYLNRQYGTKLK